METVDLNGLGNQPIKLNFSDDSAPVKLDTDIELLMNSSKMSNNSSSSNKTTKVNLNNVSDLDRELDDMLKETESVNNNTNENADKGLFSWFTKSNPPPASDSKVGQATKEGLGSSQTWDGFAKYNDSYVASEKIAYKPIQEAERRRKKKAMLQKLNQWRTRANEPMVSPDLSFEEIEEEYEYELDLKLKRDSVRMQADWLKIAATTIEYGCSTVDFDISGFSEQIDENITEYDEIFEELYERYKGGKVHPVVSLLFKLGVTAATINFTNRVLSSTATPGFQDIIKQSPELMKTWTASTAAAMSQQNPAFNFMNQLVQPPTSFGPKSEPPQHKPTRPDLTEARGLRLREEPGVDLYDNNYHKVANSNNSNNNSNNSNNDSTQTRPPMRGPSADIEQMFAGLKPASSNPHKDDSIVSISSIKDLQNTQLPKHNKNRRNRSDKNLNVVSLDI
jgi:hypothetical protein